jgi:VanZ family protein
MKIKYYLYPVLWLLFVTGLSVMPSVALPQFNLFSTDKLAHFFVYFVLCLLMLYGWRGVRENAPSLLIVCAAVALSALYGSLMEWVQYAFVPGRMYELDDMIANAAGAVAGGFANKFLYKKMVIK